MGAGVGDAAGRGEPPVVRRPTLGQPHPGGEESFSENLLHRELSLHEAEALGGKTGGAICGIQIEANFKGVRDTPESRKRFGEATAQVVGDYLSAQWGLDLTAEAAKVRATK